MPSNAISNTSKNIILTIYMLSFYCSHGNPLIMPLLPFIVQEFQLESYEMGLMITLFAIPGCFIPLFGMMEDRIGRRPMLYLCILGSILSIGLGSLATSYRWLLTCRFFHGLFTTPLEALVYTLIADYFSKNDRSIHVGRASTILFVGVASIPVITTGIQYIVGWRLSLLLPLFMGFPILFIAWKTITKREHKEDNYLKQYSSEVFRIAFSRWALSLSFVRMAVAMCLFGIVYLFLPMLVTDIAKVSPYMVGICFALTSATMSIASYSTNWHMTKLAPGVTGSYGGILFTLGLFCLLTSDNIGIIIFGLLACGWVYGTLSSVGTVYYSQITTPSTRGALMAIYSMLFRASQAVGVTLMSLIFKACGMSYVLFFGITLTVMFSSIGGITYHMLAQKKEKFQ